MLIRPIRSPSTVRNNALAHLNPSIYAQAQRRWEISRRPILLELIDLIKILAQEELTFSGESDVEYPDLLRNDRHQDPNELILGLFINSSELRLNSYKKQLKPIV